MCLVDFESKLVICLGLIKLLCKALHIGKTVTRIRLINGFLCHIELLGIVVGVLSTIQVRLLPLEVSYSKSSIGFIQRATGFSIELHCPLITGDGLLN